MSELRLYVDPPAPGVENMRLDAQLLQRCTSGDIDGAVRIYAFSPPCLSLGRMQSEQDVDTAACVRDGVDVVRRPSGGRAVLHDREVTYAVVCRAADPDLGGRVRESCARIHRVIAAGLARLGVVTAARGESADERVAARARAAFADCFAQPSAHELVDQWGRKLVGSAQARRGGALLQHGSVLLARHRAGLYLLEGGAEERSSSLEDVLSREVDRGEVVDALVAAFGEVLGPRLRDMEPQRTPA